MPQQQQQKNVETTTANQTPDVAMTIPLEGIVIETKIVLMLLTC
jgi:hypothetical protein